ncbi:MAG: peptide chain release factor 3 [Deltaproteobacteria bacterium]|nr:peptide chain release factor 3 [Deltaproteobacteria bacterium]
MDTQLTTEIARRRTFAIISHPDAGKTTLTEKLLLYANMIRTAGMVRGRKAAKTVSSDWMQIEQERGISITASAMQFNYHDCVINVLDTPGHQDFSEDTYRTLTAADSAVMVIDAAKGVEAQTRKLFSICRLRGIPIMTFINKLDLPSQDFFDLLAELEDVLGIKTSPLNWPVGSGKDFIGVVDRQTQQVLLFEKAGVGGSQKALVENVPLAELLQHNRIPERIREQLLYELELLDHAGNPFSLESFLAGEVTPVFFGSALTNFGVETFFDNFCRLAPAPGNKVAYDSSNEEVQIDAIADPFSAYVFKIQANMDPKHRDSMAFMRICSGLFERDLTVKHHRSGKEVRLSRSHAMFGGDRNTVDLAYAGDIVGVINPGFFAIGDTVSMGGGFNYKSIPKFPPEIVAGIRPLDVLNRKSFDKGLQQLSDEGTVLVLNSLRSGSNENLVAAVGKLQFDVLQFRLESEYRVRTKLEVLPYRYGAWLVGDAQNFKPTSSSMLAQDASGRVILLYTQEWERKYVLEQNPGFQLLDFQY